MIFAVKFPNFSIDSIATRLESIFSSVYVNLRKLCSKNVPRFLVEEDVAVKWKESIQTTFDYASRD